MNQATEIALERFDELGLPPYMRDSLENYLEQGIHPGSFLQAVLENNLTEAFGRADMENGLLMKWWAQLMYSYVPAIARGSANNVNEWINHHGFRGLYAGEEEANDAKRRHHDQE